MEPTHTIPDISCQESDGFMYENEENHLRANSDSESDIDDDFRDPDWVMPKKKLYESSKESSDSECEGRVIESTLPGQLDVDHEEIVDNEDKKKKKKHNIRECNQKLRMEGKAYLGINKKATGGKAKYLIPRSERIMKDRPCKEICVKGTGGKRCMMIDDNTRQTIFSSFWKELDWHGKKFMHLD